MATIPAFSPPDWLKTETAEQIQARMMESLPPDIDDTEAVSLGTLPIRQRLKRTNF